MTIRDALAKGHKQLSTSSPSGWLDVELLLAHVLKKSKVYLHSNPEKKLIRNELRNYDKLLEKRKKGWPVAYLVGHKDFFGLKFLVTKDVLIPRPETEELVEIVLKHLKNSRKLRILDLGTGSGNIIISLAKNWPNGQFFASDISSKALLVARKNARRHGRKITFKQGSLWQPWKNQTFDIIVANLPYLSKQTDPSIKNEPKKALVATKNGLGLFEQLFLQTSTLDPKPSTLSLEIGHDQAKQIKKLAHKYLPAFQAKIYKDLSGRDRFAIISSLPFSLS